MAPRLPSPLVTPDGHHLPVIHDATPAGSASVVVMAHGIFTDKREKGRFDRLAQRIVDSDRDAVRFDFRGHGESPFPFARFDISGALLDYVTVLRVCCRMYDRVSVVASSFGASISLLERLLPYRSRVRSYALLNPVVDFDATFIRPSLAWGKHLFSPDVQETLISNGRAVVDSEFSVSYALYFDMVAAVPARGIPLLDAPTLVLHGDADDKVPVGPTVSSFSSAPNVALEIVPGAQHAFKDPAIETQVHSRVVEWLVSSGELG